METRAISISAWFSVTAVSSHGAIASGRKSAESCIFKPSDKNSSIPVCEIRYDFNGLHKINAGITERNHPRKLFTVNIKPFLAPLMPETTSTASRNMSKIFALPLE